MTQAAYHDPAMVEDIQGRCIEEGDCLIWQGRTKQGMPVFCPNGSTVSARKALYEAIRGPVPAGKLVSATCGHPQCMARAHIAALTPLQSKALAVKRGAYQNPARVRKAAATVRAKSRYPDEVIAQIREAESPQEASRMTGVNLAYAYAIRAGVARREYTNNPFSGLGARV
jgi:hypothetical protein